jgi:hypothetical protein
MTKQTKKEEQNKQNKTKKHAKCDTTYNENKCKANRNRKKSIKELTKRIDTSKILTKTANILTQATTDPAAIG